MKKTFATEKEKKRFIFIHERCSSKLKNENIMAFYTIANAKIRLGLLNLVTKVIVCFL